MHKYIHQWFNLIYMFLKLFHAGFAWLKMYQPGKQPILPVVV